jgi:Fe2+ transport system protein FeoA
MKVLSDLKESDTAKLISFSESLPSDFVNDLLDNGLYPGSSIKILKIFTSQKKILIQLGEVELVIRSKDAEQLYIQ